MMKRGEAYVLTSELIGLTGVLPIGTIVTVVQHIDEDEYAVIPTEKYDPQKKIQDYTNLWVVSETCLSNDEQEDYNLESGKETYGPVTSVLFKEYEVVKPVLTDCVFKNGEIVIALEDNDRLPYCVRKSDYTKDVTIGYYYDKGIDCAPMSILTELREVSTDDC